MFTELMPLLRKRRLLMTIALVEGDTIRATVVPQKASDTEDNALTTPLAITGTAEEPAAEVSSPWKYRPILSKSHLHSANSQL